MEARPFLVTGFSFRLVRSKSRRSRTSQLGLRSISCLHISAPLLEAREGIFSRDQANGPTLPPNGFGKDKGRRHRNGIYGHVSKFWEWSRKDFLRGRGLTMIKSPISQVLYHVLYILFITSANTEHLLSVSH